MGNRFLMEIYLYNFKVSWNTSHNSHPNIIQVFFISFAMQISLEVFQAAFFSQTGHRHRKGGGVNHNQNIFCQDF